MEWAAWGVDVGTTARSLEILEQGHWEGVIPGDILSLRSQSLRHHVSKESYVSVSVSNNIFFSSSQNTNSIPNSVLSLKVMPLKTAL